MLSFQCAKWFDLHVHLRQDALLPVTISDHLKGGCAGVLAMPNTKPPVASVFANASGPSIESYLQDIQAHGGDQFEAILIPLYITRDTTPAMIEVGATKGLLKACKYYPPHGTTGAEFGMPLQHFMQNGVLQAMADHGVILCVHGEMHDVSDQHYFDKHHNAETQFYQQVLPRVRRQFPKLKIVCEHITTKVAVDFVTTHPERTAATITPQHLLYTIGDLVRGFRYHRYCLPLLKFEEDRLSLRKAVTNPNNQQFFAGSDSAPHTHKTTPCGCAAGCYTAPIAPALYAEAFEEAGLNLALKAHQAIFKQFLCELGPKFYDIKPSKQTFTLSQQTHCIAPTPTDNGDITPLKMQLKWKID